MVVWFLGFRKFWILPQLASTCRCLKKMMLIPKMVKNDLKIIISLCQPKSLTVCVEPRILLRNITMGQFHQHFTRSFYNRRSQLCKKIQSNCQSFLRFWDLCAYKMCLNCWWNWQKVFFDQLVKRLLASISSTFYARIFCTKVCSKPNSKQRKSAQKTFERKTWE